MPRQSIEEIQVGSNPVGRFNDGYIYSLKLDLGYSQAIDKVTISVVDSSYIESDGENYGSIRIGTLILRNCHLIASDQSVSPAQNIVNYTFCSKSFVLDQMYVGLVGRHCRRDSLKLVNRDVCVEATCPDCDGNPILKSDSVEASSRMGFKIFPSVICMGNEIPSENGCDVPEVLYSLNLFQSAVSGGLQKNGINFISWNVSSLLEKYNYTGSLREVLSNICREIAHDFYYDWQTDSIVIYDLSIGVSFIPDINTNKDVVASANQSSNVENTYVSNSSTFGFKPGGKLNKNFSIIKSLDFENQSVSLLGDWKTYFIAGIFGKIDSNARKLFYMKKGLWDAIGLVDIGIRIDPFGKNGLFAKGFDVKTYVDIAEKFKGSGLNPSFAFFLEDSKLETYYQEYENYLIENYGKNFYSADPNPINYSKCFGDGRKIKVETQYVPDIEYTPSARWAKYRISKNNNYCPPFEEINISTNLENYFPVYMDYVGQVRLAVLNAISLGLGETLDEYAAQGNLLFALIPSASSIPIDGKFGELTKEHNSCEPEISYGWYTDPPPKEDEKTDECKGKCDASASDIVCKKIEKNCDRQIYVPAPGHRNNKTTAVKLIVNRSSLDVKLPVIEKYYGVEIKKYEIEQPYESEYIDPLNNSFNSSSAIPMRFEISTEDISSSISLCKPEKDYNTSYSNTSPEKTVSFKVIGISNISKFPLEISQGLSSISMYIEENGSFADLVYKTKAPVLPPKEIVMQKTRPNKISL